MVNFDNVTSNVQSKPRKKTMAESLEEAKQEGKLVVPEEDTQVNAVVSSETIQTKNKARKKKQSKVRKQEELINGISQANEDNDFKDVKTDKRGVPVGINVPQHILDVVCIVKFNAAFRRHTSLNILHTLEDDGRIYNVKGAYVDFLWNKFRVTADGGLIAKGKIVKMPFAKELFLLVFLVLLPVESNMKRVIWMFLLN